MNHSEYYSSPEHWPQPPDEPCTLDPMDPVSISRKKKKKSGRVRKNMSQSLAGVVTAALAVVMVATSIPELGGIVDDIPILPDLVAPEEICTVCNTEDCPYFADGYPGLRIMLDCNPEHVESDDIYSMYGFCEDDWYYHDARSSIFTSDGDRIVFRLNRELRNMMPMQELQMLDVEINAFDTYEFEDSKICGVVLHGDDDKSPYKINYFQAVIVYDSSGSLPQVSPELLQEHGYELDYIPGDREYIIRDIEGVANAQLQVCSNIDQELLEFLIDYIDITIVNDLHVMDLGQTMRFAETEFFCRNYYDIEYNAICHYYGFNIDGHDLERTLCFDTSGKEYQLRSGACFIFHEVGWKALFDTWQDLNEQAPETGHEVYFPLVQLNSITVNNINYDCYLAYSSMPVDDINNYQWAWLFVVPKQEDTIAIEMSFSLSPEELTKLLEQGVTLEHWELEVLDQITLK